MLDPLFVLVSGQPIVQVDREGRVTTLDLAWQALAVTLAFFPPDAAP